MMCFGLKERKRLKTNHCVIVLLDDTQLVHELHASSTGQDLLDVVIKHLNLLETSYFGLRYFETATCSSNNNNKDYYQLDGGNGNKQQQQQVWLDVDRSAIKQLRNVQPMTVYFGVKYYAPDPCKLAEEITRYQFFLQCKQDILQGRLAIPFELAVELFALAVQSELGDYDPQRHQDNYVAEFQFLPPGSLAGRQQLVELELRVAQLHRQLSGQVPATAELNFLERVKWLDLYGCELHPIQYDESPPPPPPPLQSSSGGAGAGKEEAEQQYALGLNPSGVSVLRNRLKVAHYAWPRIVKTKCQGRCFLMDVIAAAAAAAVEPPSSSHPGGRQRFGFRLADKLASRRLRWALEQHKSFYHLINNNSHSAALSQRQRLGQRFRHSIRSAIQLGAGSSSFQQQQQLIAQQQQQLRSSMKSAAAAANGSRGGLMAAAGLEPLARQPPAVVRMPSRRYSQRSAAPPAAAMAARQHQQQQQQQQVANHANGLPMQHHAHTMLDHQRQQALIMMSQMNAASQQQQAQFNQLLGARNSAAGAANAAKSQTLRPISSKQAAANREKNQYYHQMMMAMMANQQQQQPPASIYKASSVINNMNQLGLESAGQTRSGGAGKASMMQQLFSRPAAAANIQYGNGNNQRLLGGQESPRSTKSAIAPSSALKLASKKLARQQQLLFSQLHAQDAQPLLAYEAQQQQLYSNYYGPGGLATAFNVNAISQHNSCNSANASPRSARSARLTSSRHKSKSINENLHLLHLNQQQQQQQLNRLPLPLPPPPPANANRMLLATATQLMQQQQQQPPPPNYEGNARLIADYGVKYSDNESEFSKLSLMGAATKRHNSNQLARKRATFALSNEQANRLLLSANSNNIVEQQKLAAQVQRKLAAGMGIVANDDDAEADYCCSRSDCSSLEDRNFRPARPIANQKKLGARMGLNNSHPKQQQQQQLESAAKQRDWNSIRRRHEDFSRGKSFQMGNNFDNAAAADDDDDDDAYDADAATNHSNDANNNHMNSNSSQLVKNIANKQATPILLSMNYQQADDRNNRISVNNNKAVQLLNSQRRQLNSCSSSNGGGGSSSSNQSSTGGDDSNELAAGNKLNSRSSESAGSSAASSPQQTATIANGGQRHHHHHHPASSKTADSTVSNSSTTTSGYYAGSNSTGSASADSDTQTNENPNNTRHKQQQPPAGSRAKIALGSHAATRMAGDRLLIGNQAHFKACVTSEREAANNNNNNNNNNNSGSNSLSNRRTQTGKQFYLGCEQPTATAAANSENSNNNNNSSNDKQPAASQVAAGQWSPLSQIQQHPNASLKYVSFDV